MLILLAFAFLAGLVTVLSPCILPLLPIILSSSIGDRELGKNRPLGVVAGFVLSFTFFTLFLSSIVRAIGIPADTLRILAVVVIALFGASLLMPQVQLYLEQLFSRLTAFAPRSDNKTGFGGGLVVGASLGLLWTPCVGPILAAVISLAISGSVTAQAFLITFAFSLGTALPMLLIMRGGQTALRKVPWLVENTPQIQKAFGILMVVTAVGIFFNVDRRFQAYILDIFPQYGAGLTQFEDNHTINELLEEVME